MAKIIHSFQPFLEHVGTYLSTAAATTIKNTMSMLYDFYKHIEVCLNTEKSIKIKFIYTFDKKKNDLSEKAD